MINTLSYSSFSDTYEDYMKMPAHVISDRSVYLNKILKQKQKNAKQGVQ